MSRPVHGDASKCPLGRRQGGGAGGLKRQGGKCGPGSSEHSEGAEAGPEVREVGGQPRRGPGEHGHLVTMCGTDFLLYRALKG